MKSAAMTIALVMFNLVSLDNVPTMAWSEACGNQPWNDLCPETLKNAPRLTKLKYRGHDGGDRPGARRLR
jgi:hypothetical protein